MRVGGRWHRFVCAAWLGLLSACGGPSEQDTSLHERPTPERSVEGAVVAHVDGEPVSLEDVRQTTAATELSPEQALHRIEEEVLLAAHAERAGYGATDASARQLDAARVRALLRTAVEAGTAPGEMPAADVHARFDEIRKKREKPEGRAVLHVLFRVERDDQDARAAQLAAEQLAVLRDLPQADLVATMLAVPASQERDGVAIVRERIPEARPGSGLARPFEESIFAKAEPGLVADVVRTSFGYHVIAVQDVLPPLTLELAELEGPIRKALSIERRAHAVEALIRSLEAQETVQYHEAAIARGLSDDQVLGQGM